jgi:hypothetical protein
MRVRVEFADGTIGIIDTTEFFENWKTGNPQLLMQAAPFASGRIDEASNALIWSKYVNLTGEGARGLLDKSK